MLSGFLRQDEATRLNLLSNPQSVSGFAGDGLWLFVHFLAPLHPLLSPEFRYSTLYVLGKPPKKTLDTIPFPRYHFQTANRAQGHFTYMAELLPVCSSLCPVFYFLQKRRN